MSELDAAGLDAAIDDYVAHLPEKIRPTGYPPTPLVDALASAIRTYLSTRSTPTGEGAATCDECGGPALTWFAPNALWNLVKGGSEAIDDPGGMLCPNCFIRRAEEAGIVPTAWVLDLENLAAPPPREDVTDLLREALADAEYQPGDHPVVPVKIAAFMGEVRAALKSPAFP